MVRVPGLLCTQQGIGSLAVNQCSSSGCSHTNVLSAHEMHSNLCSRRCQCLKPCGSALRLLPVQIQVC